MSSCDNNYDWSDDEQYNQDHHDDNPESKYNDGKGIRYAVTLHPLPPLPKAGEKRCRNAKVDHPAQAIYVHEDDSFAELLDAAINSIGYANKLKFKIVADTLRPSNFSVTWTINRSDFKNQQLTTTEQYTTMITEALEKAKPAVKLDFVEIATKSDARVAQNVDTDEPEPTRGKKKRTLTEEEESMAEIIVELKAAHLCSDKSCSSRWCFLGNPAGIHVRLTPIHFSSWVAARLAKVENVDNDNPPPLDKTFWPTEAHDNIDDIALLASRRRNQLATGNGSAAPSITVNNDFAGIAALLQPFVPAPAPAIAPASSTSHVPVSPAKCSRMTIAEFCVAFKLSDKILLRLEPLELTGPHLLDFVENSVLDTHLKIGQRTELHYAEAEWKKGKKGVE
ncbi:hypothetical protein C8R43DRAFT_957091 [Mycena crocata]|nr:hypothetical protein C8R43DRAFT_957091 [Mycena crocata]